jgi:tetratricopeptide (TPR) repeat protein
VRSLAEKQPLKQEVLASLRGQPGLAEPLRRRALALAEGFREDATQLNNASWLVVCKPGAAAAQYQLALRQAQAACRIAPSQGVSLNTLGVALYRVGRYDEAVKTLLEADRFNAVAFGGPIPGDWAFLAMAYHRLGQKDQAANALARLRDAMRSQRRAQDPDALALRREAEDLLKLGGGGL